MFSPTNSLPRTFLEISKVLALSAMPPASAIFKLTASAATGSSHTPGPEHVHNHGNEPKGMGSRPLLECSDNSEAQEKEHAASLPMMQLHQPHMHNMIVELHAELPSGFLECTNWQCSVTRYGAVPAGTARAHSDKRLLASRRAESLPLTAAAGTTSGC